MPAGKKRAVRQRGARNRTAQDAFREIGAVLASRQSLDDVLRSIVHQIEALPATKEALLYLLDESWSGFIVYPRGHRRAKKKPIIEDGIAGWTVRHGKSIIAKDSPANSHYSLTTDLAVKGENRAICCVPIKSGVEVRGVIEVSGKSFSRADLETLRAIAELSAVAIQTSIYVATIEELTITDDLTGLYNAKYLGRVIDMEIKRAQRYDEQFTLVFIDLDKFKGVNDRFGHLVGSRVLTETGHLIAGALRKDIDSAFRYGGDEFVMVLPKTDPDGAMVVAKRIQSIMRNRDFVSDDGERFKLTVSLGIAAYPRDATSREDIIRLADEAMYQAKRAGRDAISSISSMKR